ncbi:MAG: copper resistance protein B [Gammaproteobacteria bacterium]|nr:copper resistance protein B [Gammaproteobacteria bacterium]
MSTILLLLVNVGSAFADDDDIYSLVLSDRLEYQSHGDTWVWDAEAWVGGDYHKVWLKTQGENSNGQTEEAELQLLYSRAVSPFFDLQLGVRHDFEPQPSRTFAVVGLQGLAPQWIELDVAAFISEDGDFSARLELEYDLLLTQRLTLQPRIEIGLAAQEVAEHLVGKGLTNTELGLRLRYEVRRKLAPYLGVTWRKSYGGTRNFIEAEGGRDETFSFVTGIRFWF